MARLTLRALFLSAALWFPSVGIAQAAPTTAPSRAGAKDYSGSSVVTRMLAFDKNHDGQLTRDEVTDERLHALFDEADANGDGVVTKAELAALAEKLDTPSDRGGGPGNFGGPDRGAGFGGSGVGSMVGPGFGSGAGPGGGPGRFGGPPQPGQILSPRTEDALQLSADQKKQLDALQAEVNQRLAAILTEEQNEQLAQMHSRGPGRGGPPGGPPPGQQ